MEQFVEFHYHHDGEPIIINAKHIAYIRSYEKDNGCHIYLACVEWNRTDSGYMHSFHVRESYSRVKAMIFDYE